MAFLRATKSAGRPEPRGSEYPIFHGLVPKTIRMMVLGPGTLNIGYLDCLEYIMLGVRASGDLRETVLIS